MNFVTLKMGVALHISLQLANHQSQRSDFGAVCKANNGTLRFHYRWLIFFYEKEGTTILERVAFLLRLSILDNFLFFRKAMEHIGFIHVSLQTHPLF